MTANDNVRNGWWQRLGASSGFLLAVVVQTGGLVWWASGITQTQKSHGEEIVALRKDWREEIVELRKDLRDLTKLLADSTGPTADIKARLVAIEREVGRIQADVENIKSRGWKR